MATTKITNPELFDLGSLDTALKLPSGTTAERPTSPSTGEWRYNTTTNLVEFWDGGSWRDLQSEEIPPIPSEHFNTVLYTGTGSAQSITGVGFKPDFVWIKQRNGTAWNSVFDSTRGAGKRIVTNSSNAENTDIQRLSSFDADGFSLGSDGDVNGSGKTFVAWCWKANGGTTSSNTDGNITSTVQVNAKAGFSIITYTGNGSSAQTVGHGLGVAPKIIFIKERAGSNSWDDWIVGGDEINNWTKYLRLNTTDPPTTGYQTAPFSDTAPTSSVFTVTYQGGAGINGNGDTFVAYAFAEKAGYSKFGSYTGNGTTQVVNTGFKPGWIMIKSTAGNDNWRLYDTARGITAGGFLEPNRSDAEDTADAPNFLILSNGFEITAGGTTVGNNVNGNLYTYYAFASDQSAAPVLADSFANKLWTGDGSARDINVGFSPSWTWIKSRSFARNNYLYDILRGPNNQILSNSTGAEATITGRLTAFNTGGFTLGSSSEVNNNAETYVAWNWKANPIPTINTDGTIQSIVSANQAAGFSIVKYTGNNVAGATIGHGLSSAPDIIIVKNLDTTDNWTIQLSPLGYTYYIDLNNTNAATVNSGVWYAAPTSNVFSFGANPRGNGNGNNIIAYCFNSIAGFSKIGSYTGNGSATGPVITTGFQPDFVMIKSSSLAGTAWMILDSARSPSNPRQLLLQPQSAAIEQNVGNAIDFNADNFQITDTNASRNQNGATYIYMAFKIN